MKFSCEQPELLAAVTTAARAASAKSPIPALEGLLIEAGDTVRISGYDLKKGVYTTVEADVKEEGAIVLGARILTDIIRSLPNDVVQLEAKANFTTVIRCGASEFRIIGSSFEDYPELPVVDYKSSVSIKQSTLKKMISETAFAVSINESRPVLTGELLEIENGVLTMVAVDGYRLALRREAIDGADGDKLSFIVPGSAMSDVEKIASDSDEEVRIVLGSKHVSFAIGKTVLISRRLEGEFLDFRSAVPEEFKYKLLVVKQSLLRTVERVSLMIEDRIKNPLRCTFGDGVIKMNCVTAIGRAEDFCPVEGTGEDTEVGFNNRFLLDAVKAAPADELHIRISSAVTPCVITPADGSESFLYLILPVRLRAGE